MALSGHAIHEAGETLWRHWRSSTCIDALGDGCRPRDRAEGYAIQAEVARLSGQPLAGWKIAATSVAGQRHLAVDAPLAGRLLANRQIPQGGMVPFAGNAMRVAEAEFAFQMAAALPRRSEPWSTDEVLAAVGTVHPAIEIPDSRFINVPAAGAPQLIADTACACWFVIGEAARVDWRACDLAAHRVAAYRNEALAAEGIGANVLGDPRAALTWLANELNVFGEALRAGDVVITGTCIVPVVIAPGDALRMDFRDLGQVTAVIARV